MFLIKTIGKNDGKSFAIVVPFTLYFICASFSMRRLSYIIFKPQVVEFLLLIFFLFYFSFGFLSFYCRSFILSGSWSSHTRNLKFYFAHRSTKHTLFNLSFSIFTVHCCSCSVHREKKKLFFSSPSSSSLFSPISHCTTK